LIFIIGGFLTAIAAFGGYGFTSRQWGLALDPIFAINAVLANGTIIRASQDSNPDLFWVSLKFLIFGNLRLTSK